MKYKGYEIWNDKDIFGRTVLYVGNIQQNGKMLVHSIGHCDCLTVKQAADIYFGRL